jgi:hypothetical protein
VASSSTGLDIVRVVVGGGSGLVATAVAILYFFFLLLFKFLSMCIISCFSVVSQEEEQKVR